MMSRLSKEESAFIDKMFSWCASSDDISIIKQSIAEVKKGNGLYDKAVACKGDLYSFKSVVAEHTGLDLKASGELSRILWALARQKIDRERKLMAGITHATWVYEGFLCKYQNHSRLNGKRFSLKKGIRVGFFKRLHPGDLVGCVCMEKPEMPF